MGATHVTVTIRNPAAPDRTWEGLFLVDTGRPIVSSRGRTSNPSASSRKANGRMNWPMGPN